LSSELQANEPWSTVVVRTRLLTTRRRQQSLRRADVYRLRLVSSLRARGTLPLQQQQQQLLLLLLLQEIHLFKTAEFTTSWCVST